MKVGDDHIRFNLSAAILTFSVWIFGFSAFLMLIWNDVLVKSVHGLNPMTYWQSVGLLLLLIGLSRLLLK